MKQRSKTRRLLSCLLALLMMVSMVPVMNVSADSATGTTEDGLEYEISDGEVTITSYTGSATEITIPSEIDSYPVTSIGRGAFSYCDNLDSITIPDSVTNIGEGAFSGCSSLENIVVDEGNSVYDSRENCNAIIETETNTLFFGCKNTLIPHSVTSIGSSAFHRCTSLEKITIPEGVTLIDDKAFYGCNNLNTILLPDSITEVGAQAFYHTGYYYDDNNWENDMLYINDILLSIGKSNFEILDESYVVKDGTKLIAEQAICFCSNVKTIFIPESVKHITLSEDVVDWYFGGAGTYIYSSGFYTADLEEIVVDENNESFMSVNGVLVDKNTFQILKYPQGAKATTYCVPSNIKSIANGSFAASEYLRNVIIPKNITSIGEHTFKDCNDLSIFGYKGSEAERYAKDNKINFIPFKELTDGENDVTVEIATDDEVQINVSEVTNEDVISSAEEKLDSLQVDKIFDITLTSGGKTVQPMGEVTVKIPTEDVNAKVYRVEHDSTLTDINAVYSQGYVEFTTNHFSLYVLAVEKSQELPSEPTEIETITTAPSEPKSEPTTEIPHPYMVLKGDTDGSDKVNVKDATSIQKAVADLIELSAERTFAANVIATDVLNVKDATTIQKWVAGIKVNVTINEYVPYSFEVDPSEPEASIPETEPTEKPTEMPTEQPTEMPTESADDVAIITCGGKTYTAKVGDVITYTAVLKADKIICDVQGNVNFDGSVLKPITESVEDTEAFASAHCPNLTDANVNQNTDNSVIFLASNVKRGFNFKSSKVLITYSFIVQSAEKTEILLDIDFMSMLESGEYYFDEGKAVITDGISIKGSIAVS